MLKLIDFLGFSYEVLHTVLNLLSLLYTLLAYQPYLISHISVTSVADGFLAPQYFYTHSHLIILSLLFFVISLLSIMVLSSFQRFGRSPRRVQSCPVLLQNEFSLNNTIK